MVDTKNLPSASIVRKDFAHASMWVVVSCVCHSGGLGCVFASCSKNSHAVEDDATLVATAPGGDVFPDPETLEMIDEGNVPLASCDNPLSIASHVCVDADFKYRGWSGTLEYYFRSVDNFNGSKYLPCLTMDTGCSTAILSQSPSCSC